MAHANNLKVSGINVAISYASENDHPVTEHEVEAYIARAHDQRPGARIVQRPLQIARVIGFVGVNKDQIKRRRVAEMFKGEQRRAFD